MAATDSETDAPEAMDCSPGGNIGHYTLYASTIPKHAGFFFLQIIEGLRLKLKTLNFTCVFKDF